MCRNKQSGCFELANCLHLIKCPYTCLLKKYKKTLPEIWKQQEIIFIFAPQNKFKTANATYTITY